MATCSQRPGNPGFFDFLGDPIGTIIKTIANFILAGAISLYGEITTSIPTLSRGTAADEVSAQTQWIVVYTAIGSLIAAAVRMALERRGDAGATALKGLLRVIFVAGAATAVVTAMASLGDRYSDFLFAAGAREQVASIACGDSSIGEAFLLLIVALLLLFAGIVHTILLYIRLGVMVVLLGTLPMAAASSMTDWGSGWWRKHTGWMIAWLLYKPAAALILFSGSAMISPDGSDIHERLAGIGVMLLSAVALPALLKLVMPATAALGTGNPVRQGMSAIASGAKTMGSAAHSAYSRGGAASGAAGPTGASSSGGTGMAGAAGAAGASGLSGGSGSSGQTGSSASGGATGATGASGAGATLAKGAAAATVQIAQGIGRAASGSIEGGNGDAGHNR
ncbi:hypothetical protein AB0911_35875 [Streptomyces nigra]|uniref:hypothetical protein n=1 Tax=Streptomyces nigra TaxID=1827580 RepID=UPI003451DE1F